MFEPEEKMPLVVSVLLGFGAWFVLLVSLCLLGGWAQLFIGPVFLAVAAASNYTQGHLHGAGRVFVVQLSLALSVMGKYLLCYGIISLFHLDTSGEIFMTAAAIAAVAWVVYRQELDRLLTVSGALVCGIVWAVGGLKLSPFYMETLSVGLFCLAYLFLVSRRKNLWPLAWALLGACLVAGCLNISELGRWISGTSNSDIMIFGGINNLFIAVFLCVFYAWNAPSHRNIWIMAIIIIVSFISNTGTVMGAALMGLGSAQNRTILKITGVGLFAISLFWLYYHMQTTLLVKSGYLCMAGIILLGTYGCLKRGENAR